MKEKENGETGCSKNFVRGSLRNLNPQNLIKKELEYIELLTKKKKKKKKT